MAGGANFGFRVLNYLVNEVIVSGLANSSAEFSLLNEEILLDWMEKKEPFMVVCLSDVFIVLESLQRCPRFQRFAVRTSKKLEDLTDSAAQKKKELAEQMKDISKKFDVAIQEPVIPFAVSTGGGVVYYLRTMDMMKKL
ncbi:hypothetical protein OROGR_018789 [Orobanche gracilis]